MLHDHLKQCMATNEKLLFPQSFSLDFGSLDLFQALRKSSGHLGVRALRDYFGDFQSESEGDFVIVLLEVEFIDPIHIYLKHSCHTPAALTLCLGLQTPTSKHWEGKFQRHLCSQWKLRLHE